ncbi:MAG: hypothetical protein QM831_13690 [Kofleriaceae bacterium]
MTRFAFLIPLVAACSVDDGGSSCTTGTTDTCTGSNVCTKSGCATAFPNTYEITALSVTAPLTKSNGDPWSTTNADGSPSLYVEISVGGSLVKTTDVTANSYNATYAGPFEVSLSAANTALDLKVSSMDGGTVDPVYDCPIPAVTASFVRTGYILCMDTGVTLNANIHVKD